MGDTKTTTNKMSDLSFIDKHSFMLFITMSILAAGFLVFIGMSLYNNSGAAQLDLSRPGYVSVRSQAVTSDGDVKTFSSSGSVDQNVITDFKSSYKVQAAKAKAVDAFSGDPLSPEALGLTNAAAVTGE